MLCLMCGLGAVLLFIIPGTIRNLARLHNVRMVYRNRPENQTEEGKARLERKDFYAMLALLILGTVGFVIFKYITR